METTMVATAAQEAPAPKVFDPIWLNTVTGAVTVYGHEFVSKQVLNIIGACLNSDEFSESHHGVFSLVFTKDKVEDSEKEEVYAMFFPEVKSIVINLLKMWDNAVEEALSEDKQVSVVCTLHHNLLFHVFHDIHHAASYAAGVNIFDLSEKEHEKSSAWANDKIVELAKTINVEPDWKSEPFFSPLIQEMFLDENEKDPVALQAKEMIEKDVLVKVEEEGKDDVTIKSFREFIRLLTDDNEEGWEEKVLAKNFLNEPTAPATPVVTNLAVVDDEWGDDYTPWNEPELSPELQPEIAIASTFGANIPAAYTPQVVPQQPVPVRQPTPYPTNGVDPATVPAIMGQVYMLCYQHIFNNCGMLTNSDVAFQNPELVTQQPVDLNTIPGAAEIVVAADINDTQGNWIPEKQVEGGMLFGNIKKTTKLPGFTLHLNINGEHHVRALIPQNPATSSQTAVRARGGNAIMWIVDNATARDDKNRWKFKVDNGVLTPCNNYASA